tara:strand:- start:1175 stop:1432 length:258 start_codon:yes stop_codon:yes gene_type:complete
MRLQTAEIEFYGTEADFERVIDSYNRTTTDSFAIEFTDMEAGRFRESESNFFYLEGEMTFDEFERIMDNVIVPNLNEVGEVIDWY